MAIVIGALLLWWRHRGLPKGWEVVSAEVNFADLGSVSIKPNKDDIQIAHRAWLELATRKAGLPFDPEHDVILEVYDSWHELFGRLRELAKECPATKVRTDEDTRQLLLTLIQVLNKGLRPHLTRWQARFRRWYEAELADAAPHETPQEVQRRFPQYAELTTDLSGVQAGIRRYMTLLKGLATGQK